MIDNRTRKYQLPASLSELIEQRVYERWLARKAAAHVKRDRKRGNSSATIEAYKRAIHAAVARSSGKDAYTGELLRWDLISKYDNAASKLGRRTYKAALSHLPTVDHVGDGSGVADFKICGWRTNDAKNDLSFEEFIELCHRVVKHHARINA
jgi:hypothetical protein